MMINKKTKLFFTIGTIAATAVSSLAAVSCLGETRFDQSTDNIIKIGLGWDPTSLQAKTLQSVVTMYNQTQKDTKDFMEVRLEFIGFSYEDVNSKLELQLNTKDSSNLYNLVMAYITGLGIISGYNMQLNLKQTPEDKDQYGLTGDEFNKEFYRFNDNIGGLPPGGIYGLPITKSTPVTGINTPLFSYIIEVMQSFGAKINEADKEWIEEIHKLGKPDREFVKKYLGEPVESEKSKYENGKFTISRELLNNSTTLIDLAVKSQQLFENTKDNPKGAFHALAIEDISNFVSEQAFAMSAKKPYDFSNYYTKIGENGYVDYSGYEDKNSESYKNLNKIAKTLLDAAKTGAIIVGETSCCVGSFPAYQFRRHQTVFSIGSSSNYNLNFYDSQTKPNTYKMNIDKDGKKFIKNISDGSVAGITTLKTDAPTDAISGIVKNSKSGLLLKSTSRNLSPRNIVLFDSATDTAVENFVKSVFTNQSSETAEGVIIEGYRELDEVWNGQRAKLEAAGLKLLGQTGKMKDGQFVKNQNVYGFVNLLPDDVNSAISVEKFSEASTLQEHELLGVNTPRRWESSNKMAATYVQGASLIGVHANDAEDTSTRKFVKWLTGKTKNAYKYNDPLSGSPRYKLDSNHNLFTDDEKLAFLTTPLEYMSLNSAYVVPFKGTFDETDIGINKYSKIAFNEFKNAVSPENAATWSLVQEPTDLTTSKFRPSFISAWRIPFRRIQEGFGDDVISSYEDSIKPTIDKNKENFVS